MNTCPNCKQSLPKWHRERAAFERGERVEYQAYSAVAGWSPWADMSDWHKGQDWRWEDVDYRFRIAEPALQDWQRNARGWVDADPYVELKAAHAAGKVIQFFYLYLGAAERTWIDDPTPSWEHPVEFYRIKPEPPPIPEGFTRWDGGECPVPEDTKVDVLFRDGKTQNRKYSSNAHDWIWTHCNDDDDIIAYRVIAPPWSLPPPPAGRSWHRDDWTQDMLPEGWRPCMLGELCQKGDQYWDGFRWDLVDGALSHQTKGATPDWYHRRTKRSPLPPSFVPWNCPEDVPLNCWIRRKGAIWMGMVVGFYATGIRIITSSLDEVEYHKLKDFEYSTDRKEWKPCTKEAK